MATNIDDVLALIASGGDSSIELADMASQTAIARALKNRQVSPVMQSGRATLPNVSGIVGNGMDRRAAAGDESRLMADRLRVQQAETDRARGAIQPSIDDLSGVRAIEDVDGGPSTLLPEQAQDPGAVDEYKLLQGATRGATAVEGQKTLRQYALTRALQQQRGSNGGAGGGNSADLQLFNFIKQQHPDYTNDQILEAARSYKEVFGVAKIAGVENIVGNRGSGAAPLTDIETVADNTDAAAAAQAAGTEGGKTEEQRAYAAPIERVMVDGMKVQAAQAITKLKQVKSDPALSKVTGFWGLFPSMPGGAAADAQAKLDSIKAMLGFDKLQEIRAQNKTGGGVGALSDPEREALERSIVAVASSQSDEQLRQGLDTLINQYGGMIQRLEAKYQAEYGATAYRRPGLNRATGNTPPAPAAAPVRKFTRDASGKLVEVTQ